MKTAGENWTACNGGGRIRRSAMRKQKIIRRYTTREGRIIRRYTMREAGYNETIHLVMSDLAHAPSPLQPEFKASRDAGGMFV